MFIISFHPRLVELEPYSTPTADGQLPRVAKHLAGCPKCQDTVRSIRAVRTVARDLPGPVMRASLFDDVERRIAADELVLLPASGGGRMQRDRSRFIRPAAAAAVIVALATWMSFHAGRSLDAGSAVGDLTLTSHAPGAPNTISAVYRPMPALASLDSVVAQASVYAAGRFFTPTRATYTLHRRKEAFVADIALPPSAVLMKFTIASSDGQRVDDNDGRSWEFVSRDSLNRATFEGLRVERAIHGMDDWERAFHAAQEMVRNYPEQPGGVRALLDASFQLAGPSKSDSVAALFRPRIAELQRRYADSTLSADMMWEMSFLAGQLRDTVVSSFWLGRMEMVYPNDPGTIQLRVFEVFRSPSSDAERLRKLDALWDETGGQSPQLLANAFELADKLGDVTAIKRWGDRQGSGSRAVAAATYVKHPELRAEGEQILRDALRGMPAKSRVDWQSTLRASKQPGFVPGQWQLASLGDALLLDGRASAALDTLQRAAALSWNANIIVRLGDAALAARDSDEATRAYAWATADRRLGAARVDSLKARLGARATSAAFAAAASEAKNLLREMALASTYRRPIGNLAATFASVDGTRRSLHDALGSGLTLVAIGSLNCGPSRADLPALEQVRRGLATNVRMITILADEKPNEAAAREAARLGYSGTIDFDDRGQVSRGLRQYGTPHYFLIENGVVRADVHHAADLVSVIDALLPP